MRKFYRLTAKALSNIRTLAVTLKDARISSNGTSMVIGKEDNPRQLYVFGGNGVVAYNKHEFRDIPIRNSESIHEEDALPYLALGIFEEIPQKKKVLRFNAMKSIRWHAERDNSLEEFLCGNYIKNLEANDGRTYDEVLAYMTWVSPMWLGFPSGFVKAVFDEVSE